MVLFVVDGIELFQTDGGDGASEPSSNHGPSLQQVKIEQEEEILSITATSR